MPNIHLYKQFFKHRLKAKTLHGTHSPFVYKLLEEVIYRKGKYYNYEKVDQLRREMQNDKRSISVKDLGAGSKILGNQRKISDIARISVKNKKLGELIYRLAVYLQPKTTLELGTSLGITTCYLSLAHENGKVITIEGDLQTAKIASENFEKLNLKNIFLIKGNFDEELNEICNRNTEFDLVFIDGNHRKDPTLKYIKQVIPNLKNGSCVIIDDIHWSTEMTEAWTEIIKMPEFSVSLDLFYMGILFIRKEQKKEHFILKF